MITKVLVSAAIAVAAAVGVAAPAGATDPSNDPSPFNGLNCNCPKTVRTHHPDLGQIQQGIHDGLKDLQDIPPDIPGDQ
jgi:hypothetical protein